MTREYMQIRFLDDDQSCFVDRASELSDNQSISGRCVSRVEQPAAVGIPQGAPGGSQLRPGDSSHVNESDGYDAEHLKPFQIYDFVQYNGDLYEIRLHQGRLHASYEIQVTNGFPDDEATVIAFDSLPEDVLDEVRTAITDRVYYAPLGKWDSLPEPLGDTEYVRNENQTYEMRYAAGDARGEVLTVEKTEY